MKIAGYTFQPILAIPALLGLVLMLLLAVWPASAPWPDAHWFIYLPHLLLLSAAIAGVCFTQTKVLFLAAIVSVTLLCVDQSYFVANDPARGAATLLLGCLFLPPLAAVLHRSQERGLFTSHGAMRATAVFVHPHGDGCRQRQSQMVILRPQD